MFTISKKSLQWFEWHNLYFQVLLTSYPHTEQRSSDSDSEETLNVRVDTAKEKWHI